MKKVIAWICCLCLMLTMLPMTAMADGEGFDGHDRMYAVDGDCNGGGTGDGDGTDLAPSHVGWIGVGNTITYENVSLENAAYVNLCVKFDPSNESTTGKLDVYLDEDEAPVASFEYPKSNNYDIYTAMLNEPVSGTHTVKLVLTQGNPNISWVQFLTDEEAAPYITDGHQRMLMEDGKYSAGGIGGGDGTDFAPSHLGWASAGTEIVFNAVELNEAEVAELCLKSFTDGTVVEVYLDSETDPVAKFEVDTNNAAFYTKKVALSKTVSGLHNVTVKITGGGPDISWIKFMTVEESGLVDAHDKVYAAKGSLHGGGTGEGDGTELYPSHVGWIGVGNYITFDAVYFKDAAYMNLGAKFDPSNESETGVLAIYLDGEEEPVTTITFPKSSTYNTYTSMLTAPVSGIHDVKISVEQGSPNISWIQFLTANEATEYVTDGHQRMLMLDGSRTGGGEGGGDGTDFAPSHIGWTGVGTQIIFSSVELKKAAYAELCLKSFHEGTVVEVYLDNETDPVAKYEVGIDNAAFYTKKAMLSREVSGLYTVTVKITGGGPDLSWIKFLTEEEADLLDGHAQMFAVEDGTWTDDIQRQTSNNPLAPSFVNWFGEGDEIIYRDVLLNDASYLQYYALTNSESVTVNVYLDSVDTDPIAVLEFTYDPNFSERFVELEETVSGLHDIIVAPQAGGPDLSWIRFVSAEEMDKAGVGYTSPVYAEGKASLSVARYDISAETVQVIFAVYDSNNKLLRKAEAQAVNTANTAFGVPVEFTADLDLTGGKTVKAFIWDSCNGMIPLSTRENLTTVID